MLEKDLGRHYEFGDFETVDFSIEEESGRSTLVFEGRPKPPAPTRLRLGLKLDTDFEANSWFGLRLGFYNTRLNARRGELRTRMEVGHRNGMNVGADQLTGFSGRFFVAPTVGFLRAPIDTSSRRSSCCDILDSITTWDASTGLFLYHSARSGPASEETGASWIRSSSQAILFPTRSINRGRDYCHASL